MAITIRNVVSNVAVTPTIAVTTDASPQVGDLLLIFHGNDYYTAASMPDPTVSPGSPTVTAVPGGSADAGSSTAHVKSYTAVVTTAGAQTVSVTETGTADEDKILAVYVLGGADTTNPVDAAAGQFNTVISSAQDAPSVSPSTSDALLVAHNNSGGGSGANSYTSPGSMTEQYDVHVGGVSGVGATEQLTASGATGVRTFTAVGNNVQYAAVSVAIRVAAAAPSWTYGYDVRIG